MRGNSNYQRAISILQTDKGYFIVAGPVVFAKHACSATFEPRLAPSSHKYSTINFHSEAATNVFRYKMKDVMFMLVYPIKGKPTKQTTEMREFVVKYPLRLMPWPTCSCNICQGKIDIIKSPAAYIVTFLNSYLYTSGDVTAADPLQKISKGAIAQSSGAKKKNYKGGSNQAYSGKADGAKRGQKRKK